MKTEYSFFRYIPIWSSLRLHAISPVLHGHPGKTGQGKMPAAVRTVCKDAGGTDHEGEGLRAVTSGTLWILSHGTRLPAGTGNFRLLAEA